MTTTIQSKISETTTQEQFKEVVENIEPRQDNGFKTTFASHLNDSLWYDFKTLELRKEWALKLCIFYKK